jgi:DNA polymerase-3 subunit alpha
MSAIEKVGLMKIDFLGLRTLTVIDECLKIIKRTEEIDLEIKEIPLDDEKTYKLLSSGKSKGVFQLESQGMRSLLISMKPSKFEDLIALLALYRPGPLGSGMVEDFIKRKVGVIPIKYEHPMLESILSPTYGIILYQEQVMEIASQLAGFTMSQADTLRRAMGKKIPEIMESQRKLFIEGAAKKGISREIAEKIFKLIEHFAGYGFNKSHSAAYALISYRTAYLKANYPIQFITALLSSEMNNIDKLVEYIHEAQSMGIKILPPDVNESYARFTMVSEDAIRFGLSAVKNVGITAIEAIISARIKGGKFTSLFDFCERVDLRVVNKKVIESLIKSGAFDSLKFRRSQLMSILERAMELAQGLQRERNKGQLSFFDRNREIFNYDEKISIPQIKEWPKAQLLSFEKELLGFYVTGHPLMKYEKIMKFLKLNGSKEIRDSNIEEGNEVRIAGIISKINKKLTKKENQRMAVLNLEDLFGKIIVVVFPQLYQKVSPLLGEGNVIIAKGRYSLRRDEPQIVAFDIATIDDAFNKLVKRAIIEIKENFNEKDLEKLEKLISNFKGNVPLCLKLNMNFSQVLMETNLTVFPNLGFLEQMEDFGYKLILET